MTAYKLMKIKISKGGYDKDEMMEKLDAFLAFGRITTEEYNELASMVRFFA